MLLQQEHSGYFYLVFIDITNELNLLLYRICVNDTHLNSLIFIG